MLAALAPLVLALSVGQLEVQTGVRASASGGTRPLGIGVTSTAAGDTFGIVDLELTPRVGLRLRSRRHDLTLGYAPRILQRTFVESGDVNRPLVLHSVDLVHTARLGAQVDWRSSGLLTTGEIDYAAAPALFLGGRAGAAAIAPGAAAIRFTTLAASTGPTFRLGRGTELLTEATFSYSAPEDDPAAAPAAPALFARQIEGRVRGDLEHRFDARNALRGTLPVTVYDVAGLQFVVIAPLAGYQLRSGWYEVGVGAGAALVLVRGEASALPSEDTRADTLRPLLRFDASLRLLRTRRLDASLRTIATLEVQPNPVLFSVDPRATLDGALELRFGERWSFGVAANLVTLATLEPRAALATPGAPTAAAVLSDTMLTVVAPLRYAIDESLSVELGARFGARGPHLGADDFALGQLEAVGFLGVSARLDTVLVR